MQEVQTRMRFDAPFTMARTVCRLMFQRRLDTLWAWLMRLPNFGPRPQTSHTLAILDVAPWWKLQSISLEFRLATGSARYYPPGASAARFFANSRNTSANAGTLLRSRLKSPFGINSTSMPLLARMVALRVRSESKAISPK